MKYLLLIITLFIFSVASCQSIGENVDPLIEQEYNIREAVFRHEFQKFSGDERFETYFLAVAFHIKDNNPDPDDKFIKRFKHNKPQAKKYSACNGSIEGVIDKETGKKGIIFYATDIKWLNDEEVEVTGGYYIDGKGAKVSIYYVILKDGHWFVIGEKIISMS